jgi:hypothetical protein
MSNATLLDEARRLLASGDAASAAAKADEALAAGAPRAEVLRLKATALLQMGRPAEAEPPLRELCELRPDDSWAYVMLARLHLAAGRMGKAQAMAERAIALDPSSAETQALRQDLVRVAPSGKVAPRRKFPVVPIVVAAAIVVAAFLLWWFLIHARAGAGVQQAQVPGPGQPQVQQAQPQGPGQPEVQQAPPAAPGEPQVTQAPPPLPGQAQVTQAPPEQPGQPQVTQVKGPARFEVSWQWQWIRDDKYPPDGEQHVFRVWGTVTNVGGTAAPAIVLALVYSLGQRTGAQILPEDDVAPGASFPFDLQVVTEGRAMGSPREDTCKVVADKRDATIDGLMSLGDMAKLSGALGLGGASP